MSPDPITNSSSTSMSNYMSSGVSSSGIGDYSYSRSFQDSTLSGVRQFGEDLNTGSQAIIDKMVDIGGWWKDFKGNTEQVEFTAGLASAPGALQSGYNTKVGSIIAQADNIPLSEGISRVPTALTKTSFLRKSLGFIGSAADAATGSLDVLEALHDENGKPGKKTMKKITKSVLQVGGGMLAAKVVGGALVGAGVTVAGAPLIAGTAALVGTGYLINKGLSYIFG